MQMHPLSLLTYAIVLGAVIAIVLGAVVYYRFRSRGGKRD